MEMLKPIPPRELNALAAEVLSRLRGEAGAEQITPEDRWSLWQQKNAGQEVSEAKSRVLHHLEQITARRPLESVADPAERQHAERLRAWVHRELCTERL
jgi:hypothetical protein